MINITFSILLIIIGICLGLVINYFISSFRLNLTSKKIDDMLNKAHETIEKEKNIIEDKQKEEFRQIKIDLENEIKEKKEELKITEKKLLQREENIDKREEMHQKRENNLDERETKLENKQNQILIDKSKVEELKKEQEEKLIEISGLSRKKAKDILLNKIKEEMNKEIYSYMKSEEDKAKLEASEKAKEILISSMQRYSADIASDQTVTVVDIPNDDMKGRLIGREGRNIRTIESVTGVDLIIDDTPEAVVVSSFDPYRREIAKKTLEDLIDDGRIHPSRIEEIYDKVSREMHQKTLDLGNEVIKELGINDIDSNLVEFLGKLHFRTSYGQNVLNHSKEVAYLSGLIAEELKEDVIIARRAGLLHDIGKAIDHDVEGSHVELGVMLAKKYNENDIVINAIASHHGDTEATYNISQIVAIADSISASRPGARNDTLENYIKRLGELESVTKDIEGVVKTYALQAGRELRVIVNPESVTDQDSYKIAREVKEKIEKTMKYPGTIKIAVVRELRAEEEAK